MHICKITLTGLGHLKSLGFSLGEAFEEGGSIHGGRPLLPLPLKQDLAPSHSAVVKQPNSSPAHQLSSRVNLSRATGWISWCRGGFGPDRRSSSALFWSRLPARLLPAAAAGCGSAAAVFGIDWPAATSNPS